MKKACLSCMGVLVTLTLVSGVILSSTRTNADPVTSTASANATVIVPSACTLTAVVNTAHSAEVPAGTYQADIGSTTFTTICNDAEGYSIYAVGNANNQYGNNKLLATISGSLAPTYDINTGTNTSGSPSSWAMKLTAAGSTSVPTIASDTSGSFSSYHTVPATNTKVVTYASSTDPSTGSSFTATYAANIAGDQPAGTYNGKVKYTMVHPATNTPDEPKTCASNRICYWPNGNGSVTDSMGDQTINSSATSADLWASNFQRSGYGFAGWSETYDYSDSTKFHGPNETLEFTAGQYEGANKGLSLYAIWIPSAGSLQNWQGCSAMNIGDTTALTDQRDNQTYAVAKLADGACWMIENLRLNDTAAHNSDGTLAQGYGGVFAGLANSETANFGNNTTANSLYYFSTQSGTATIDIDIGTINPGYRFPRFNNQNSSSPVSNMTSTNSNVYSYGNYYTWSAALANTNEYTGPTTQVDGKTSETVNTSICPSGWRLPYGRDTGNGATVGGFSKLDIEFGGTGTTSNSSTTPTGAEMSKLWRKYPNNFIYPGIYSGPYDRGSRGYYWSSTANSNNNSYRLAIGNGLVNPGTSDSGKFYGQSVRCVAGGS